jgi:acetylornithine deacetylase/succinyl-diaminopimelate desuccinylase family protein
LDAVSRLLSELVAIPSVNPMGRAVDGPEYFESKLTEYLVGFLQDRNIGFRRDPILPGRENILAEYRAPNSRRTLLFDVHQDTVPVDGMTIDPFGAKIADGKLYGRGACDVKGGMAAMLMAFARLCHERPPGSASVILALTVDEEFTHLGSSRLAEIKLDVDLAIVAEPTCLDLVTTHKGAIRWKIRSNGVACHSSTPQLGDNAIYRMADVLMALREHAAELAGSRPDPMLGPPSLSVGRIEGGQSVNVVPDWCEIEVDRRVIPGEEPDETICRVADFLRTRLGSIDRLEFLPAWVKMPALQPNMRPEDLEIMSRVIARRTGNVPKTIGVPYGTDAGPLGQAGIPCVVFGPGDITQAHTKDEWIDLDQVGLAAELYYDLAVDLG